MQYLAGGLLGVIWLYFWLRGHWFAAVLGMVPGAALLAVADHMTAWPFVFLFGAWVPVAAYRIARDIGQAWPATGPTAAGSEAGTGPDEEFADPASSAEPLRVFLPRR